MTVHWLRVEGSDAVEEVGYDPARRELRVVFAGGREYAYSRVPPEEVQALLGAESVGQFVNWRIKPVYRCREVAPRHR